MHFDAIPAELRARRQWTVWRRVLVAIANGPSRFNKVPHRADDPRTKAATDNPASWCTFEQAVSCLMANPSAVDGIGYMLTHDDPYVVFDVDSEAKAQPHALGHRQALIAELRALGTYTETSPSGDGLHVWVRAKSAVNGRHIGGQAGNLGIEVYARQFITCTGQNVTPAGCGIVDAQGLVDRLGLGGSAPVRQPLADDPSKPLSLSDAEVWDLSRRQVGWFADKFCGTTFGGPPNDWSGTFLKLIGVLDRVTGNVGQIRRIILASPMVLQSADYSPHETRLLKAQRTFGDCLAHVRVGNVSGLGFIEHGRRQWENICARVEREAYERMEAARKADEELGRTSKSAQALLRSFDDVLTFGEHKVLSRPPGVLGQLVLACEKARYAPYTKFAIPATLAAMAGIIGRGYKTASGGGINLNFILAAPSATGKTESMKAWFSFMNVAVEGLPHTAAGPPRGRIMSNGTSSIQGIIKDFEELPSCAWFIPECSSQLTAMSSGKTAVETALRDSYNELYDCGEHGYYFTVPRSVAGRGAGVVPINNLSVSTFWTTTTSKFDVFTDDALDGFLSRVVVIRHQGPAGQQQFEAEPLAPHLVQLLRDRLAEAQTLDAEYRASAAQGATRLRYVDQSGVVALDRLMNRRCEKVKNAALEGEVPSAYTAVSRVPQTAMRMAAVMAAADNPYAPVVTEGQLKWAYGYLLQNLVSLLSDMDKGELGHVAGDEEAAVVRVWHTLAKRPENKGLPGVPRNELFQALKAERVFAQHKLGRSKGVSAILAHMGQEGSLEEVSPPTGQRGRPTKYMVPVLDHPLWR